MDKHIRAKSGLPVEAISLDGILSGELKEDDLRISPETLEAQAEAAEEAGYPELGANFRRAAEMTGIPNRELREMYMLMRPGRAGFDSLNQLADRLEEQYRAPRTAALVRQAAAVYRHRGLIK